MALHGTTDSLSRKQVHVDSDASKFPEHEVVKVLSSVVALQDSCGLTVTKTQCNTM